MSSRSQKKSTYSYSDIFEHLAKMRAIARKYSTPELPLGVWDVICKGDQLKTIDPAIIEEYYVLNKVVAKQIRAGSKGSPEYFNPVYENFKEVYKANIGLSPTKLAALLGMSVNNAYHYAVKYKKENPGQVIPRTNVSIVALTKLIKDNPEASLERLAKLSNIPVEKMGYYYKQATKMTYSQSNKPRKIERKYKSYREILYVAASIYDSLDYARDIFILRNIRMGPRSGWAYGS